MLGGSQVMGCCCFFFGSISGIWCASPQPLHSSQRGKGGCPAPAVLPLGVEAVLIRNKAFICPTLCFYTAPCNTTRPQCSCWMAVTFAMESPLTEEVRAVGDLVMRLKFCLCQRLVGNGSEKLWICACSALWPCVLLPYVLCVPLCNSWPKWVWTGQLLSASDK